LVIEVRRHDCNGTSVAVYLFVAAAGRPVTGVWKTGVDDETGQRLCRGLKRDAENAPDAPAEPAMLSSMTRLPV
jgi:hypothetical protein